ncbi:MAG TPA: hypothetical protein VFS88_03260, partial [Micavibrio sp.]|nr:hypothetical protein [Micavibrio sp.]
AQMTVGQMANFINADSLAFLTIDGLYRALGEAERQHDAPKYCDACFTGEYPVELVDKIASGTTPRNKAKTGARMLVSIDD